MMRNRIILTMLMMVVAISSFATATLDRYDNLKKLSPFDRAVAIIKRYETLHKPKDWPYVGYGHRVQPGEPYKKGVQLSEAQADALLRKDLNKMLDLFTDYGDDALLLATLAYNIGPYRLLGNGRKSPKSKILKKLYAGDRNILDDYLSYSNYKGKPHQGLKKRRMVEYQLLYQQ